MERTGLVKARNRKHWTQQQAAVHIGIDGKTLSRWERGVATPRGHNILQLCKVYGATAIDLGLEESDTNIHVPFIPDDPFPSHSQDLTLRFMAILCTWPQHDMHFQILQRCIAQATEDIAVNQDFISRREALRRLALLPIAISGSTMQTAVLKRPREEILMHCAAGITACEYLSNGDDLSFAFATVSSYLPTLVAMTKESTRYRQVAARLATQCLFLKTVLSTHVEGKQQATRYAQEAVTFSEVSDDLALRITALGRLAWIYSNERQRKPALTQALQAHHLFEHGQQKSPALQSYVYGVLAKYQALNGSKEEAIRSLQQAHTAFFRENNDVYTYMDHDLANFLLDDGTTYLFMGEYEKAADSFAQIIDPGTLQAKISTAERIRVETLNFHTLALLKQKEKEKDRIIHIWKASLQGAIRLKSEQRFYEACANYDIIESVWAGEKWIKELKDLMVHW